MTRSTSLARQLLPLAIGLVLVVGLVLGLTFLFMEAETSVTGILNAESGWSKAQKQTAIELNQYIRTRDRAALGRAQANLAIITAEMKARNAIASEHYDYDQVKNTFLHAQIMPSSVGPGIFLLRHLSGLPFMRDALQAWRQTDAAVYELNSIANRLKSDAEGKLVPPEKMAKFQTRIYNLSLQIDPLSRHFSASVASGTDLLSKIFFPITVITAFGAMMLWYFAARRILRRIKATEKRFQLLFDSAADAILIVDEKDDVILEANRAATQWTASPLIGKRISELFSQERFSPTQRGQTGSLIVAGKPSIPVETQTNPIIWGEQEARQFTIRDISSRIAMEQERRVAAVMGHEMRNPLNGIINASRLLLEDASEREENRRMLEYLSKAFALLGAGQPIKDRELFESCHGVVSTLLEKSRRQSDRLELRNLMVASAQLLLTRLNDAIDMTAITDGLLLMRTEPFSVRALLKLIESESRLQAEAKRQTLEFTSEPLGDLTLLGDSHRIQQCIANITGNAIKYSPEGGAIRVALAPISSDDRKHAQLVFTVTDRGVGIPEGKREKIFQPYYQATKTDTHNYDGLGIGLYLVRTFSQAMAATIKVEDNPGGGTVVTWAVTLERTRPIAVHADDRSLNCSLKAFSDRGVALRCLVVDDTVSNRAVLRHLLKEAGNVVVEAANGEDALRRLSEGPFDVVLLDMHLPGIPGTEVINRIRKTVDARRSNPRVIVISADTSFAQLPLSHPDVVLGYLPKPMVIERLLELLEKIEPDRWSFQRPTYGVREHKSTRLGQVTPLEQFRDTFDEVAFNEFVNGCRDDVVFSSKSVELAVADGSPAGLRDALHALKNVYFNIGYRPGVLWCSQVAAHAKGASSIDASVLEELELHNMQAVAILPIAQVSSNSLGVSL